MPVDMDELERLAKIATPGEWRTVQGNNYVFCRNGRDVAKCGPRDAEFIAAANPSVVLS